VRGHLRVTGMVCLRRKKPSPYFNSGVQPNSRACSVAPPPPVVAKGHANALTGPQKLTRSPALPLITLLSSFSARYSAEPNTVTLAWRNSMPSPP
jgi:hypothetical protein